MKREDLRYWTGEFSMGDPVMSLVTPEEFAEIASAEGYVKLDVDVEALRDYVDCGLPYRLERAIRQVLAALDGDTT